MSRDPQRLPDYLGHILEAIERIHSYVEAAENRRRPLGGKKGVSGFDCVFGRMSQAMSSWRKTGFCCCFSCGVALS